MDTGAGVSATPSGPNNSGAVQAKNIGNRKFELRLWASALRLILKSIGEWRPRGATEVTIQHRYPISLTQDSNSSLSVCSLLCRIDLLRTCNQTRVEETDIPKRGGDQAFLSSLVHRDALQGQQCSSKITNIYGRSDTRVKEYGCAPGQYLS